MHAVEDGDVVRPRGLYERHHVGYCIAGLQTVFAEGVGFAVRVDVVVVRVDEENGGGLVRHFRTGCFPLQTLNDDCESKG